MDLLCLNCGEPWSLDHVVHEEPHAFERDGCVITSCPCCKSRLSKLTRRERRRLHVLAEIAAQHGDDLDGFAAFLEDFGDSVLDVL